MLDVGLCIGLGTYCAIVVGLAVGLYQLMQPTRYPNPGMSASAPAFRSALVANSPIEPAVRGEDRQAVLVDGEVAQLPNKAQNPDHPAAAVSTKRTRTAHLRGRDPTGGHGAQAAFGSYRPWNTYQSGYQSGYQSWGSYRAWR